MKYIEIDLYFLCDKVASKSLEARFLSTTKDQLADIFTNPLLATSTQFGLLLRSKLDEDFVTYVRTYGSI
jgi:hypothetical protein